MAHQRGLQQAIDEGHLDLHYWAEHTLQQIRMRMHTQRVWPYGLPGPYNEYQYINAKKKGKKGAWVSTGAAAKEMYAVVYNAASGDTKRVSFFFEHYLNMVDMGVGKGRKISDVTERGTKAHWNTLFAKWGGLTHGRRKNQARNDNEPSARRARPMMMMEIRHQAYRLRSLVSLYLDNLTPILLDSATQPDNFDIDLGAQKEGWFALKVKEKVEIIK